MYVRVAERRHGNHAYRYVHIAESYRTPDGKIRQRLIANLGNPDGYRPGEVQKGIAGLRRVFGVQEAGAAGTGPAGTGGAAENTTAVPDLEGVQTTAYDFGGAYA